MDICIYLQSFVFFRGFELMIILTNSMYGLLHQRFSTRYVINNGYLYLFTIFHFYSFNLSFYRIQKRIFVNF